MAVKIHCSHLLFSRRGWAAVCCTSLIALAVTAADAAQKSDNQPERILTITEARVDADSNFVPDRLRQLVTVGGRANVYSGVLHASRLSVFLQDEQSGIELYNVEMGEPIAEGDSVIATGLIEQYEGVTRVTGAQYRVEKMNRPMPRALALHVREVNSERYEGMLVRVQGEVSRKWTDEYGAFLCVRERPGDVDSLVVFLSFRHARGMDFSDVSSGDQILVTGVIGQYCRGGSLNSGYELYPRYPEDIRIIGVSERSYRIALYVGSALVIIALFWIVAMRIQVRRRTRELRESEERFRSIYEGAKDAILLLDRNLNVVNANPAALELWSLSREHLVGKSFRLLVPSQDFAVLEALGTSASPLGSAETEMTITHENGTASHLHIKTNLIQSTSERRMVVVVRDLTDRKQAEVERERLIGELTDALAEVRMLSGLLPICSSCKKIRDDKGYWKQLEEYFHTHSDVRFSHGLCPECLERLYPNYVRKKADPTAR